ncbi:MAG: hypothetical protein AAGA56_05180 [Myxococcota bacterium]
MRGTAAITPPNAASLQQEHFIAINGDGGNEFGLTLILAQIAESAAAPFLLVAARPPTFMG